MDRTVDAIHKDIVRGEENPWHKMMNSRSTPLWWLNRLRAAAFRMPDPKATITVLEFMQECEQL